jgi:hypothetical protein
LRVSGWGGGGDLESDAQDHDVGFSDGEREDRKKMKKPLPLATKKGVGNHKGTT